MEKLRCVVCEKGGGIELYLEIGSRLLSKTSKSRLVILGTNKVGRG